MFARSAVRRLFNPIAVRKFNESSKTSGPVSYASLGLTALALGGVVLYYNIEKDSKIKEVSKNVKTVGKPAIGGPWVLVDSEGVPKTDASFLGKFTLLYFGFTHCPDICPSELVKVGKVIDSLEIKGHPGVVPLFISVDPSRDTIKQLKFYGQDFHKSIVYLTGTKDQVAAITKAFRVYFSKAIDADLDSEDEYLVDHSIVLYLVGPDGEFLEFFTQKMEAKDIVERIIKQTQIFQANAQASAATTK